MSEAEIKRRQDYKRNRQKWIFIQAVAIAVVLVIALASFLIYDRMNRTYYIEYTESGSVNYKVKYKENGYFTEDWIGPGMSYVTSLTDTVSANFNYKLNMDTSNVGFDYTYGVTSTLIIADKSTGSYIFSPIEEVVAEKTGSATGTSGVSIGEVVNIDYDAYNTLAHQFISTYDLKSVSSYILVTLNVNMLSNCDEFESSNENSYSISLNIPLQQESFSMFTTSSVPEGESKVLACKGTINQTLFLVISIIAVIIAFLLGCYLAVFVLITKNHDVNYANKVKKLLSSYRSFIQQIDGEFDTEGYQIVPIKSFVEMLGIRDTLQSPVLMWENKDETMTQFLIPTHTKLLYTFEIKVDNYDEIYSTPVEEHHGTVYEYEDEDAIIIDETVNMDDLNEAMATPDVILSEIDFVQDDDVDYEGTEEKPGVEVVGVVWPERRKNNKVYRYDPNGETLVEGEMVLVPTRDAARDREVIRKAAVAHANHVIDPDTHPHVLKKIIGVIRTHAESLIMSTHITEEKAVDEPKDIPVEQPVDAPVEPIEAPVDEIQEVSEDVTEAVSAEENAENSNEETQE